MFKVSDNQDLFPVTFEAKLAQAFNTSAPLLTALASRGRVLRSRADKAVAFAIETSSVTSSVVAEGASFTSPTTSKINNVVLGWGRRQKTVELSDEALSVIASSNGQSFTRDLLQQQLSSAFMTLGKDFNADLYNGSGSNYIIGLDTAVAVGDYSNLDRTTNPDGYEARGNVTNLGGALTIDAIAAMETSIVIAKGETPDLICMHPNMWNKFRKLLEASSNSHFSYGPDTSTLRMGASRLFYGNAEVIADPGCPSGTIYFLNTNHLEVHNFVLEVPSVERFATLDQNKEGSTGLVVNVQAQAKTGTSMVLAATGICQLVVRCPSAMGRITNVS